MEKFIILIICTLMSVSMLAHEGVKNTAEAESGEPVIIKEGEDRAHSASSLIITVSEGASKEELKALLDKYGLKIMYEMKMAPIITVSTSRPMSSEELDALIEKLEASDLVQSVSKDYINELH